MEWVALLKDGGPLGLAGIMTYLFLAERVARDKERDAATSRYDSLLAILLKHMPDSIKADVENVTALRAVDTSIGGMRGILDLLVRKVGA